MTRMMQSKMMMMMMIMMMMMMMMKKKTVLTMIYTNALTFAETFSPFFPTFKEVACFSD